MNTCTRDSLEGARKILIHGWGLGGTRKAVKVLGEALRNAGHVVVCPSYGSVWSPWYTRFMSRRVGRQWANFILPGDVIIGHSNGARVAWEMSYYTRDSCSHLILINPALDSNLVPGHGIKVCDVLYNPYDWVVWWARWIPLSDWGIMGKTGYQPNGDGWPPDGRMRNHMIGRGHGSFERPEWTSKYVDLISLLSPP